MSRLDALQRIAAGIVGGELVFTSDVGVTLRIRQALEDPDLHVGTSARLIGAEPLLAARVVAMANAVAFNRSGQLVTDVASAVARLGLINVRALAHAVIALQIAGALTTPAHRRFATQLWTHTAHVASLARLFARRVTRHNPDTALFAGLIHDIGGFYLISRAGEFPALLEPSSDVDAPVEALISTAVMRKLAVPQLIVEAVLAVYEGYLEIPPVSLGDTVLLAAWLAPVPSPLRPVPDNATDQATASVDMALGGDGGETLKGILEESADEITSLARALMG